MLSVELDDTSFPCYLPLLLSPTEGGRLPPLERPIRKLFFISFLESFPLL